MNKKQWSVVAFVFVVIVAFSTELRASDPVGIYGVIEKVVFEPSESAPQRIQVWGAFSLSDGKPGSAYLVAQRGYLYFTLPAGKEEAAKREWSDLKSVAGTGKGVAFGTRYDMKVQLRKADDKPQSPDRYPIGNGVTKTDSGVTMAGVKELLRKPR